MASTPSWPSLYNPGLEILHIGHHAAAQPGAVYLHKSHDIFRFTLYWSLVFYTPITFLCGIYAFLNLAIIPSRQLSMRSETRPVSNALRMSKRRPRISFAFLVLFVFLTFSVGGAVLGSVVIGYVLSGLYRAADYNMSTWVPLLWALIQVLVSLLGLWPSIIEII